MTSLLLPVTATAIGLTGTFGAAEIAVPRVRLDAGDGKTAEWKGQGPARLSTAHAGR